jgi:glucose-6-phosphate 1-dehydrogenase
MSNNNATPTAIVIYGASGDLTRRKLIPSLFDLYRKQRLPENIEIVGFARRPYTTESFRKLLLDALKEYRGEIIDLDLWNEFSKRIYYHRGNLDQIEDYRSLETFLDSFCGCPTNRLYYLATAPSFFTQITRFMGEIGMAHQENSRRNIIIEKPFGHDLSSARELNSVVHSVFQEDQIYRIDHYLGKETAQNILFFRFANTIFEPLWNRQYISNVQVTVTEDIDIGHRAGYYDSAGVIRDMFQNHLMQLLTLIAMEPPYAFDATALRNEKVKVLSAIRPIDQSDVVLAQYDGYREAEGVANESRTPTYAVMRLFIDNWRWKGVPFYLRSGKALPKKTSEITITFQTPPHVMFNMPEGDKFTPNTLSICIQPDEGIHLQFETKKPDSGQQTQSADMEFHYKTSFGEVTLPDAYERLLLDALNNDASLFARNDEIDFAWGLVDPIIHAWELDKSLPIYTYEKGSWGPKEANELLQSRNHFWKTRCGEHRRDKTK